MVRLIFGKHFDRFDNRAHDLILDQAAAHLFEQQENWKAAIGVYQKMTKLEGPRAAEAKARLSQLRLEKFIWD